MIDVDALEKDLEELGQQLATATAHRNEIMNQVREAIRRADRAGLPRTTIINRLGVARQTVYDALKD